MMHPITRISSLKQQEIDLQHQLRELNIQGLHRSKEYDQKCEQLQRVQAKLYAKK